jgi:hypothetical protein
LKVPTFKKNDKEIEMLIDYFDPSRLYACVETSDYTLQFLKMEDFRKRYIEAELLPLDNGHHA